MASVAGGGVPESRGREYLWALRWARCFCHTPCQPPAFGYFLVTASTLGDKNALLVVVDTV